LGGLEILLPALIVVQMLTGHVQTTTPFPDCFFTVSFSLHFTF